MDTRIGVIYPGDGALDRELWQFAPAAASLHLTRTTLPVGLIDVAFVQKLVDSDDIELCGESLRPINPAAVTYACTSGSFINGAAGERKILERIEQSTGAKASTTSTAIAAACEELGLKCVCVAAPYVREITERLGFFLAEKGLDVAHVSQMDLSAGIADVDEAAVVEFGIGVDRDEADGLVISCTNLRSHGAIPILEEKLGKPVITANQATIWHACKVAGVQWSAGEGVGRLWGCAG